MLIFVLLSGLDPSGYRSSNSNIDENDALLGGQAQMRDEERFKVRCFIKPNKDVSRIPYISENEHRAYVNCSSTLKNKSKKEIYCSNLLELFSTCLQ